MAGITNQAIIFISLASLFLFVFLASIFYILRRLGGSRRPNSTAGDPSTNCTAQKQLCCICCRRWTCTEPPSPAKTREVAENIPQAFETMTAPEIHRPRNSTYTNKKKERVVVDSSESSPNFGEEMKECYHDEAVGRSIGEWSFLRRCPEGTADKFCY
ncbi:hypothetical protein Nepgr_028285 [Nepenthes gracilis]|uniref:Uncharacterized protein n=1 Tax=Nepenthes gracilis TaxID=150966 RepID=A0AAD3Y1Z2_NEPGR|nr:hypothetical protein Nepgr_028285 [Nepenthes gracilis]